ncbi:hypothetical protein VaNZ11_005432, partial [Volvox africanus]
MESSLPISPRSARSPERAQRENRTGDTGDFCDSKLPNGQMDILINKLPNSLRLSAGSEQIDSPERCMLRRVKHNKNGNVISGRTLLTASRLKGLTIGQCAAAASLPFAYLPVEGHSSILSENHAVIYHVLRNLGDPMEVARAATVSRLWCDVASVPSLWTALLECEHRAASLPSIMVVPQGANADRMPSACDMSSGTSHRGTLQSPLQPPSRPPHCSKLQQLHPLLPKYLLQPAWDVMNSPVDQLGRWMGIRRLKRGASRLGRVRGSWAAYEPVTSRLVVLDQKEQKVTFVDLDLDSDQEGHIGDDCECGCGHGGGDCAHRHHERAVGSRAAAVKGGGDADAIGCSTAGASGAEMDRPYGSRSSCVGNGDGDSRSAGLDDDAPVVRRRPHDDLLKPEAPSLRIVMPGPLMAAVLQVPVPEPNPDGAAAALVQLPGAMMLGGEQRQQPQQQQQEQYAAGVGPAPLDVPEQQQPNNGPEVLSEEERHKLQVWDASRTAVAYTLPRVEGCGRGPVFALAADDLFLAAAYSGEVLVWELRRHAGKAVRGGGGGEGRAAAPHCTSSAPSLIALIKPTLATAVRSMALSCRHGVLAMRSWDGVELREIQGGRWLNCIPDRRNTALLAAGDVLFVASSSPSFLGNSFLEFEIEVLAIDLLAVMAAVAAADVGRDGTGAGAAADAPQGRMDGSTDSSASRRNGAAARSEIAISPLVVRT